MLAGGRSRTGNGVALDPGVRMEYLPQNPVFRGEAHRTGAGASGAVPEADRSLAEYEAKTILTRLGVSRFEQSGGRPLRRRAPAGGPGLRLAHPCDVLILDEPTNHLDNEMVLWLEDYLRHGRGAGDGHPRPVFPGADREPHGGGGGKPSFHHEGNYDKYLKLKAARLEMARASERKRQAILRREYQWMMQGPTARGPRAGSGWSATRP